MIVRHPVATLPLLLALFALPQCGTRQESTQQERQGVGGALQAGVYTITDAQSFAIDGGFYYWQGLTTEEVYSLNDGPDQQWQFSPSGSGFTICNVGVANACLSDGGGALAIGVGTDVWTVSVSGSGYAIQNQRTGAYVADPQSPADQATVPMSGGASSWTLTAQGGTGGGLQPGAYYAVDSSGYAIDGGFFYWNHSTTEEVYTLNDGPDQQWQFSPSGSGFTICNVGVANACLSDGGGVLDVGTGNDTWSVTSSGSGYTIQNQRTGQYIADASSPADTAVVPMSSTASVWSLQPVSGSGSGSSGGSSSSSGGSGSSSGGGGDVEYDDTNPAIVYSLGPDSVNGVIWDVYSGGTDFGGDEHSSNVYSSSFVINFTGTDFQWIGKKGPNYGIVTVYLDGSQVGTIDNYNPTELDQQVIYSVNGLNDAPHIFRAAIGGYPSPAKNPASSNTYQTLDAFVTSGTPLVLQAYASWGSSVGRNGSWTCGTDNQTDLSGGHCWSNVPGSSMSLTFDGTGVEVYARPDGENGKTDVYFDGTFLYTYDGFGLPYDTDCPDCVNGQEAITIMGQPSGQHTIQLVVNGQTNPQSVGDYTQIDEFQVIP